MTQFGSQIECPWANLSNAKIQALLEGKQWALRLIERQVKSPKQGQRLKDIV